MIHFLAIVFIFQIVYGAPVPTENLENGNFNSTHNNKNLTNDDEGATFDEKNQLAEQSYVAEPSETPVIITIKPTVSSQEKKIAFDKTGFIVAGMCCLFLLIVVYCIYRGEKEN